MLTPEEKNACVDCSLAVLLEKGYDSVFIVQQDGTIAYANAQAGQLLGFADDELLVVPYASLFIDTRKSESADRLKVFFSDKKEFDRYESEMVKKDKQIISTEISVFSAVFRGNPAQVTVVRDVTAHKKIEIEQQQSTTQYKELASIVDRSFEAIMITDNQGTIQYVNASWEHLNGWKAEEVIRKVTPRVMKSGMQSTEFYKEFWDILMTGNVVERIVVNKRKDGTLYDAEIIAMPIKDDSGAITRFAGFQHDITARNQAQVQITQAWEFSEEIIERANAIVIVSDATGVVTRFNQKAEEVMGYTKEEILGKSLFETVFPREKYPLLWSEFTYTKEERGMTKNFENSLVTKKGDERFISWSVSEITRNEETVAIISFGFDITEKRNIEADLLEKNKDLERFKDLMVGRELKMIELKKELDGLKQSIAVHAEKNIA